MAELFDLMVMLTADMAELRARLIKRWLGYGFDAEQARERALSNDIPNAELVVRKSLMADLEISSDK